MGWYKENDLNIVDLEPHGGDLKEENLQKPKLKTKKIYFKRNDRFNPKNNQDLRDLFSVMLAKNEEIEKKNLKSIFEAS